MLCPAPSHEPVSSTKTNTSAVNYHQKAGKEITEQPHSLHGRQRVSEALTLLASYLKSIQFELKVLLFIEKLLESVSQDNVCVIKAAVFLVELVIGVIF